MCVFYLLVLALCAATLLFQVLLLALSQSVRALARHAHRVRAGSPNRDLLHPWKLTRPPCVYVNRRVALIILSTQIQDGLKPLPFLETNTHKQGGFSCAYSTKTHTKV